MLHVVVDGVPRRTERTLLAIGIVIDDVNTGNASFLVDGNMVVCDATAVFVWEDAAIASGVGRLPYTLHNVAGIEYRVGLAIKLCTLATNHIKQDAELIVALLG